MIKKFNITGMTCSACSAHVEKAALSVKGVTEASVNLLAAVLTVKYDESTADENAVISAVISSGYGASVFTGADKARDARKTGISEMKRRVILSFAFLIPLMYFSMGHMLSFPLPGFMLGDNGALYNSLVQLVLCLPVLIVNRAYFIRGFSSLFRLAPNMDTLISVGSASSFIYGVYAVISMAFGGDGAFKHDLYFESAAMIPALIGLGKYFEAISKGKTSEAVEKLTELAPKYATVERGDSVLTIPVSELVKGDTVQIKPGEAVSADGEIISGITSIDCSAVTGESIPVMKTQGDSVVAGTVNKNGFIRVRVTKTGEETALAKIISLIDTAVSGKAPISYLADRVSAVFVPAVIAIALITFSVWLITGAGFDFALARGISVLVISCPCALGLATPVAITVGMGKGAEKGILFKSGEALQRMSSLDCIVLDKTGTVTYGKPEVQYVKAYNISENELLSLSGALEAKSSHPLAKAVESYVTSANIPLYEAENVVTEPGYGIRGFISGKEYFAGNKRMLEERGIGVSQSDKIPEGMTSLYFASESALLGVIGVADRIRETSAYAVDTLKKLGNEVIILTGDNASAAKAVSEAVGADKAVPDLLPGDKASYIEKLRADGKKVGMVGDGINDSPALASADVGIAIGTGTDIAVESADVVLMKSDINDVPTALGLSARVMKTVKQNLFWAFFYNVICIPVAAGVFYNLAGLKLNPMIAAGAMSISSLFVVCNSLRIRSFGKNKVKNKEGNAKMKIRIEGMMCKHCQGRVENALNSVEGVKASVDLKKGIANVNLTGEVSKETLTKAVTDAGYKVISIEE